MLIAIAGGGGGRRHRRVDHRRRAHRQRRRRASAPTRSSTRPTGAAGRQDVVVIASDHTTIVGVAGMLAIGGTAGIGVGVDIEVITKTTSAIDRRPAAGSRANGDVVVSADSSEKITSISVGGAARRRRRHRPQRRRLGHQGDDQGDARRQHRRRGGRQRPRHGRRGARAAHRRRQRHGLRHCVGRRGRGRARAHQDDDGHGRRRSQGDGIRPRGAGRARHGQQRRLHDDPAGPAFRPARLHRRQPGAAGPRRPGRPRPVRHRHAHAARLQRRSAGHLRQRWRRVDHRPDRRRHLLRHPAVPDEVPALPGATRASDRPQPAGRPHGRVPALRPDQQCPADQGRLAAVHPGQGRQRQHDHPPVCVPHPDRDRRRRRLQLRRRHPDRRARRRPDLLRDRPRDHRPLRSPADPPRDDTRPGDVRPRHHADGLSRDRHLPQPRALRRPARPPTRARRTRRRGS